MKERRKGWMFLFLMSGFMSMLFGLGGQSFGIGDTAANISRHLSPIFLGLFLAVVLVGLLRRNPTAS